MKEMERYMLEGNLNFAEILQKQRAYNRHAKIETTSAAKVHQSEAYRQQRKERNDYFYQVTKVEQKKKKRKRRGGQRTQSYREPGPDADQAQQGKGKGKPVPDEAQKGQGKGKGDVPETEYRWRYQQGEGRWSPEAVLHRRLVEQMLPPSSSQASDDSGF